jgi:beta-N-acetylhexosaminidase
MAGIADGGVQACARPMRERSDYAASDRAGSAVAFGEGLPELDRGAAMPLQKLIRDRDDLWLQATTATYTAIDSLPLDRSARALGYFLRQKLHFEGVVLSPRGGDVNHLRAGAEVVVAPHDPFATVEAIVAAVNTGTLTTAWLDATVRKLLLAKAHRDLDHMPMPQLTAVDPHANLQQLDRAIGKATMVVLRDVKGRLPLGPAVTQGRVAAIAYGLGHKSELQSALDPYMAVEHYLLSASTDSLALAKQVERYKKYDYVIIGLHQGLVQDQADGRLLRRTVHFLEELDRVTKLVVIDFAGRNSLEALRGLSCLTFVVEDHAGMANLAGQAIMGAFPITALLPDDASPSFPAGSGKVLPKKLRLEYTDPADLGVTAEAIWRIDSLVESAIKRGVFPGCQVFAAKDGKVFLHQGYGYHDYSRAQRVGNADLYDIASVSKIASTTLMAMSAFDQDTLKLDQPLKYFMPDLDSSFITIKDITPQQLLTHAAGLPPGIVLNKYFNLIKAPDSIRIKIYSKAPDNAHEMRVADDLYMARSYRDTVWNLVRRIPVGPGGTYKYSDLSMYLLKALLERMLDTPIERYVQQKFYDPMGLRRICYNPRTRFEKTEIVPTAEDKLWRKQVLQGDVHDETVAFLGGVGGPAGIFSTSGDLGTLMQMLMNGGSYGGRQYLTPETVAMFTSRQPGSHRGLGFDKQLPVPSCEKGYCCFSADPETFGHIGFTGTCAWADPRNGVVYVFLSNRVYPDARNGKINAFRIRQGVQQLIYDALHIGMPKEGGLMVQEEDCYMEGV